MRSLRLRVLVGALLWTLGLFIIISTILTRLILTSPHTGAIFHHLFSQVALMSVLAIGLLVAGFVQVRSGLAGIGRLREKLGDVHAGREPRIDGMYPSEVQPLVDDLNALLETHDRNVTRAQAKAGDLAHGLKTPLAILTQEADRARAAGHADLADALTTELVRMRRQIDYHLAHARAAASAAAPTSRVAVGDAVEGLRRTLLRLHADRHVSITTAIDDAHAFRGQRADLDEMLGNLLDNACKWARSAVHVSSAAGSEHLTITVDDDGPGLAPAMRAAVLQRGVRADEAAPGDAWGWPSSAILRRCTAGKSRWQLRPPADSGRCSDYRRGNLQALGVLTFSGDMSLYQVLSKDFQKRIAEISRAGRTSSHFFTMYVRAARHDCSR